MFLQSSSTCQDTAVQALGLFIKILGLQITNENNWHVKSHGDKWVLTLNTSDSVESTQMRNFKENFDRHKPGLGKEGGFSIVESTDTVGDIAVVVYGPTRIILKKDDS